MNTSGCRQADGEATAGDQMKHNRSVDWVVVAEMERRGKSEKYPGDKSNRVDSELHAPGERKNDSNQQVFTKHSARGTHCFGGTG